MALPVASGRTSSASSQKTHGQVAYFKLSLRAAEKSSIHGKWYTFAPKLSAISTVRSVDPVSTKIISENHGFALCKQSASTLSSFLAIITREIGGAEVLGIGYW